MPDPATLLRATPLGKELGAAHSRGLAELMTVVSVDAGEALFSEGDPPNAIYIVAQGAFSVMLPSPEHSDDLVIAVLGPGGIAGELEVFTDGPRMASVVASERSSCLRLPAEVLRKPPAAQAEALSAVISVVARVLALRLAAVNGKLVAAWNLPQAGTGSADPSNPALREVLDDVWRT